MRLVGVIVLMTSSIVFAGKSVFNFSDLNGYEKCLRQDHLIETVKTDSGAQTRALDPFEIRARCVQEASKILSKEKNPETLMSYLKATKRLSNVENSLEIAQLLANVSSKACNDMDTYLVIKEALSVPKNRGADSQLKKADKVVRTCLKDAEFKKDFMEELDSSDAYLKANTCDILLEEKLVKSCPQGGKQ